MKRIPRYFLFSFPLALLVVGFFWMERKNQSIATYIPPNPLWVYQSNQLHVPPLDPTLQQAASYAQKWWKLAPKVPPYWFASGHEVDAQSQSYVLYVALPVREREVIAFMGGKISQRPYKGYEMLTFHADRLHAVHLAEGWLISPSLALLEKSLDERSTSSFRAMPLHPDHSFSALYINPRVSSALSNLSPSPWREQGVYYFRPTRPHADRLVSEFLTPWHGQNPQRVTSWSVVPDPVYRIDFWQISSVEAWKKNHPEWPTSWHFLFPETGGACWQFFPKGETPIVWLPIQHPDALTFLSGGQLAQAGIYPLVIPTLAEKILGEKLPAHRYFAQVAGGIALSESASALEWYQSQQQSGTSAAQSQRFQRHILPVLLPRQSRFTLTFPSEGPSFLAWEGMNPKGGKPVVRLSWGNVISQKSRPTWIKQGQTPPPRALASNSIRQDSTGFWWVGQQRTQLRSPQKPFTWATWHPDEGIWIGHDQNQEIYHVKSQRLFPFSGDSRLVGLVQQKNGQTCAVTRFGQITPLNSLVGLLPAKSQQLERIGRLSSFRVLESSTREMLIVREDPTGLAWFGPSGEKITTIPGIYTPQHRLSFEVLPNNLQLLIRFDGHSHYLYSRDGTWLGQKSLPGTGAVHIRYAASYRKLMVYTQQEQNTWDLWALGPIDD